MEDIQIYYTAPMNIVNNLKKLNLDVESTVRSGYKSDAEIKQAIMSDPGFCRDEKSITKKHLLGTMSSNISLYAILNEEVVGMLTFMFNQTSSGDNIINFDGICSPAKYSRLGVGKQLIETLIKIGKINGVKFINLECTGSLMNYYKNKFGFTIVEENTSYDSDDDSEDEGEAHYLMTLDLSSLSGGKKKHFCKKKSCKKKKNSCKKKKNSCKKRKSSKKKNYKR
jgi:hypothetical protein